jgi:putative DNA primase/helicase
MTSARFDPEARSELWDRVLRDAIGDDQELHDYVQRALGSTLSGENPEKAILCILGPGNSGKTTIIEAVQAALGDYAGPADPDSFLAPKQANPGAHRTDLVALFGLRLITLAESERGGRMSHKILKRWSGGDSMSFREAYTRQDEGRPVKYPGKLCFGVNDLPKIDADDDAMWSRIKVVPFERVIPPEKRDPEVGLELLKPEPHGEAILAWLFRGYQAWRERGLGTCEAIEQKTEATRKEMDPLARFLEDYCTLDKAFWTEAKKLRDSYEAWCEQEGERAIRPKEFGNILRSHGCEPGRQRPGGGKLVRGWKGIDLHSDAPRKTDLNY